MKLTQLIFSEFGEYLVVVLQASLKDDTDIQSQVRSWDRCSKLTVRCFCAHINPAKVRFDPYLLNDIAYLSNVQQVHTLVIFLLNPNDYASDFGYHYQTLVFVSIRVWFRQEIGRFDKKQLMPIYSGVFKVCPVGVACAEWSKKMYPFYFPV